MQAAKYQMTRMAFVMLKAQHWGNGRQFCIRLKTFWIQLLNDITWRRRRRRKFNTSIEPAVAYENESVFMSGPVQQWPAIVHRHPLGPCAKPKTSWHQMHPETAPHV